MLAEPTAETETDLLREAREASQIPLPAGDSSGTASEGGSAAVRLRELELEERRRSERSERLLERPNREDSRSRQKRGKLFERLRPKDLLWKSKTGGSNGQWRRDGWR